MDVLRHGVNRMPCRSVRCLERSPFDLSLKNICNDSVSPLKAAKEMESVYVDVLLVAIGAMALDGWLMGHTVLSEATRCDT